MNALGQERGFTVAEVLLAAAIVALAFVALATIIPISTYAVQEGNQYSTATFLADQKLELVRNVPWTSASAIAGFSGYSRAVRVTDCGVAGCAGVTDSAARLVVVTISYTPLTGIGQAPGPKSITQTMVMSQR